MSTSNTPNRTGSANNRIDRERSVTPILTQLIRSFNGVTEDRLQKTIFYAEVTHYSEYGERLTSVEWQVSNYGVFSPDVQNALERLVQTGCETKCTVEAGREQTRYIEAPVTKRLTDEQKEFVDTVIEDTQNISMSDLLHWTNNHPLSSRTDCCGCVCFDTDYNTPPLP